MRFIRAAVLVVVALAAIEQPIIFALAKKPPRSRAAAPRRPPGGGGGGGSRSRGGRPPVSRRRSAPPEYDDEGEEEDDVDEFDFPAGLEEDEDNFSEDEDEPVPKSRKRGPPASSRSGGRASSRKRAPPEDEYDEDAYYDRPPPRKRPPSRRGGPPPRGRGPPRRGGRVVPYKRGPSALESLSSGLSTVRGYLPDPSTIKNAATTSFNAARETTSGLSANIYREVKGLTSSELEQVMLKATRPDDAPVKSKHVERLIGVTYQINSRYDIYDAVLRKLWKKMTEKDWRTTVKALYILHRFSADGAPEHAPALKARLRELRRTRDPKKKDKYFNSKQLLAGDSKPENIKYRAFMSRYAHYVLLRTQCFGGMFDEIAVMPKPDKKKGPKPITQTSLRAENLEAAQMLLKAGCACQLKDGEECENTAIAVERVASDMIGLTAACATALNRVLKNDDLKGADPALVKRWCTFYSEACQPQAKAFVKTTAPKLDAYGLFLPSRMGTTLSPGLLEKGLNLKEDEASAEADEEGAADSAAKEEQEDDAAAEEEEEEEPAEEDEEEEVIEKEADFVDEYETEDGAYYYDEYSEGE